MGRPPALPRHPARRATPRFRLAFTTFTISLPWLLCLAGFCGLGAFAGGCASDRPEYYHLRHEYNVADPQFARTMNSLFGPPILDGNGCTTLLNGRQIFPDMLGAVRSARRSITLETFIYWSGTIGKEFTDALSERARAGVKVHVLFDAIGSDRIDDSYIQEMKKAGVHVVEYHPFHLLEPTSWALIDHRTHRKLLVVDGAVGFTGGAGIADEWSGNADSPEHWRDNHYRVTGPVVAQLQAAFMDHWMQTTGEVLGGEAYFPPLQPAGSEKAQVVKSSWEGGAENMQLMFLMSVTAAAKTVRLESAYFVPDALTRKALIEARRRGATVEIIVPGKHIDEKIVRRASRACWPELLKAGVAIYEYQPTMFHCKLLVVDDLWVSIGSSNIDNRSFRLNDEANLNVLDGPFAAEQVKVFEQDKQHARRITLEELEDRPLLEKIMNHLASLLGWEI